MPAHTCWAGHQPEPPLRLLRSLARRQREHPVDGGGAGGAAGRHVGQVSQACCAGQCSTSVPAAELANACLQPGRQQLLQLQVRRPKTDAMCLLGARLSGMCRYHPGMDEVVLQYSQETGRVEMEVVEVGAGRRALEGCCLHACVCLHLAAGRGGGWLASGGSSRHCCRRAPPPSLAGLPAQPAAQEGGHAGRACRRRARPQRRAGRAAAGEREMWQSGRGCWAPQAVPASSPQLLTPSTHRPLSRLPAVSQGRQLRLAVQTEDFGVVWRGQNWKLPAFSMCTGGPRVGMGGPAQGRTPQCWRPVLAAAAHAAPPSPPPAAPLPSKHTHAPPAPADNEHSDIPVPDFTYGCYPEARYANSSWPAISVSRGPQRWRSRQRLSWGAAAATAESPSPAHALPCCLPTPICPVTSAQELLQHKSGMLGWHERHTELFHRSNWAVGVRKSLMPLLQSYANGSGAPATAAAS